LLGMAWVAASCRTGGQYVDPVALSFQHSLAYTSGWQPRMVNMCWKKGNQKEKVKIKIKKS
jgi:hypothetical protein